MKILRAFQVISMDGAKTVSVTYNEADSSGNITKTNEKESFYALDEELKMHIDAVEEYINKNRLAGE